MSNPRTHAQTRPDQPAYIMGKSGEVVTWIQLEERANRGAHFFRQLGLKVKDKIAIMMENNEHFLEIAHAAIRAGLFYTPISSHLVASEIEYIVKNCEASLFITSYAKKEIAAELIDILPNDVTKIMTGGTIDGYDSYEDTIAKYPTDPISDETTGRDMLYSSGTTGLPKGILTPFPNQAYGEQSDTMKQFIQLFGVDENTVYISPAPLYHAAPLAYCNLVAYGGGTSIIMENFDAHEALKLIEKYKVTHSQWVPTMFIRMLKLPEEDRKRYDLSSLKFAVHAAAPIPVPVKEQMIDWWGPIFIEYYSGTEQNGSTLIFTDDWLKHKGSVGRAAMGQIHILDEEDNILPPGEPGTVYFSGAGTFEYYKDPDKTSKSRNSIGGSTLGDIGYLDEEGYLYLTDRKTNMIISGGVNIYPQETENHLITHPKVMDVAVLGIPHEEFGEEVKAVVQPVEVSDAGPELEQELIAFCKSKLSGFKCPRSIDFVDELPRTPTGKLLKRLLKEKYWEGKESKI